MKTSNFLFLLLILVAGLFSCRENPFSTKVKELSVEMLYSSRNGIVKAFPSDETNKLFLQSFSNGKLSITNGEITTTLLDKREVEIPEGYKSLRLNGCGITPFFYDPSVLLSSDVAAYRTAVSIADSLLDKAQPELSEIWDIIMEPYFIKKRAAKEQFDSRKSTPDSLALKNALDRAWENVDAKSEDSWRVRREVFAKTNPELAKKLSVAETQRDSLKKIAETPVIWQTVQ